MASRLDWAVRRESWREMREEEQERTKREETRRGTQRRQSVAEMSGLSGNSWEEGSQ